jgi:hypothetical protein
LGYSVADGTFQWTGKSDLTQADILSHGSERVENKSELEDMIREWLSGGEKPVTEINELAEGLGFSPKAVYTARKKLCDKPRRVGGTGTKGHWVTKLKEQCVITNTCGKG